MSQFRVDRLDHVELFVPDRYEAAAWYARVLGLSIAPEYEHWAADPNGPLMIAPAGGGAKLALFTGEPQGTRPAAGFDLVAFRVSRRGLDAFQDHIRQNPVFNDVGAEVRELPVKDHGVALSVYFYDPYGNQLELTTYVIHNPVEAG